MTAETTGLASSTAGTLASVPLRAVPMGVRAAATIAARDVVDVMYLPVLVNRPSAVYTVK